MPYIQQVSSTELEATSGVAYSEPFLKIQHFDHLAGLYNIPVEEAPHNLTDEQRKVALQREGDLAALEMVQQFFEQSLVAGTLAAKRACAYASKRWALEYCRANGIGYAPYPK